MTISRWGALPASVREAIFRNTEGLVSAEPVSAGSAEIAYVLTTIATPDRLFLKGVRGARAGVELRVQRFLPACAPRLRWHTEADGYLLLAFDYVDGRHAVLSPGSPDLPFIGATLAELSRTACPQLPVLPAEDRWAQFSPDRDALAHVSGNSIVHTDLTAENVIMTGQRETRIVDWAWPTRGAPWLDTAAMVVRLIQAGHRPEQAERWASGVLAYREAPRCAVAAYAAIRAAVARARGANVLSAWEQYLAWLTLGIRS